MTINVNDIVAISPPDRQAKIKTRAAELIAENDLTRLTKSRRIYPDSDDRIVKYAPRECLSTRTAGRFIGFDITKLYRCNGWGIITSS
jgi:hypothetical protein